MPLDHTTPSEAPSPLKADRRQMLRSAGLGAAAVIGTMGAAGTVLRPSRAEAAGVTDADVLNFALNLEYLEAEFYKRAVFGTGLTAVDGTGTPGGVTGGSAVPFQSTELKEIATAIARDEVDHVTFLRTALGSAKVARPQIDLAESFIVLARACGIAGPNDYFNPFYNDFTFVLGAYIFEDVGVTAYKGAAGFLSAPYLPYAAGILGVEAYHAGILRLSLIRQGPSAVEAARKISALRQALSNVGGMPFVGDQGPGLVPGAVPPRYNMVPTDSNAIAYSRTPTQVLNVVYGNTTATPGLFFPKGMNGTIK